jgi:hypothetical protein
LNHNITIVDFFVLPFLLLIVYTIFLSIRNKKYPQGHPWRKYYIPALTVKIAGAIFVGLIYEYYYKGGDTFNYFNQAKIINSALQDSVIKWGALIFKIPTLYTNGYYDYISQLMWYTEDPSTYYTCSITSVISLFTWQTYLPTATIFAAISFTGTWALFKTFSKIYPALTKQIAIATCFIPSVFIWGSGVFKDTICMFSLGWLTYTAFEILVNKNSSIKNILLLILSFLLIAAIKVYILMAFIPAIIMWILFNYSNTIHNKILRIMTVIIVIGITGWGSYSTMNYLGREKLGKYSLDKITETAKITRDYIVEKTVDEGSSYDLEAGTDLQELFIKLPLAVNVTLFRPYIWESKKLIILFSAIESFLFLIITLKILLSINPIKLWRAIARDPNIQFFLIFTIIFAFAVGLTSGNFGTLSRYKIPCLPFFSMALVLIYYKNKPLNKKLFKFIGI